MNATAIIGFLGLAAGALLLWAAVRLVNRGWRKSKWIWAAIFLVIVGYPLGYGPMLWLFSKGYLPGFVAEVANTAYIPLFMLVDRTDTIPLFEWYGRLWVRPKPEVLYDNETPAQ